MYSIRFICTLDNDIVVFLVLFLSLQACLVLSNLDLFFLFPFPQLTALFYFFVSFFGFLIADSCAQNTLPCP